MVAIMDVIDGDWIKARLKNVRGEQSRLARRMGVDPDVVTKILKGHRRVQPHEMPAVVAFFQEPDPTAPTYTAPGMAESQAALWVPTAFKDRPQAWADQVRQFFGGDIRHPQTLRLGQSLAHFSLLAGDVLVLDMARTPGAGELALVTVEDATGAATTQIRRYLPPWLLAGDPADTKPALRETDEGLHLRYPVVGSFRVVPAEEPAK